MLETHRWDKFVDSLEEELASATGKDKPLGLICVVISEDFRRIITAFGHETGETIISEFAKRIRGILRPQDTLLRVGDHELFLILPELLNQSHALLAANRITELSLQAIEVASREFSLKLSCGIALSPDHGVHATVLIQGAQEAQLLAADSGKDYASTSDISAGYNESLLLEQELRRALRDNEIEVAYQPQVDIIRNQVIGLECLARWENPRRGQIPPLEFVAIAERTGLITQLTRNVFKTAMRQFSILREGWPDLTVAINLSSASLGDEYIIEELCSAASIWSVPLDRIVLEVTESVMMINAERCLATLNTLRKLGIMIAIDDFGTGYSSLAYLRDLPVDHLKIDKSFIQSMKVNPGDERIVHAIVDLGHHLDMAVIAEGVEEDETLNRLRQMGCDVIQGYLYSQPLPVEELEQWLNRYNMLRTG